ncbi:hypothetical protein [Sinorhizobium fredii]|uniref:Uncharacterized protein n=1 Tax=Rhizobium fredii TaxID=380 RepID=A0A2L0HE57_RHIFR|nr:hypothetical protein [Sinorhizobium fredii]AUX79472.1 hypothetical protein NXT3_PC00299 [Sinorhizobium fredii]
MTNTTEFISELIRAANETDKLTVHEISRLLDRSIDTIRDMRERSGIAGSHRSRDVLIDLRVASERASGLSLEEIRDALIDAADVIRTLKIEFDGEE